MLTDLFDRSLQRAQASPHAADLEAFAAGLQVSRYALRTIRRHVRRLHVVLSSAGIERDASLTPEQVCSIFAAYPKKAYTGTRRLFSNYLQACGRLLPSLASAEPRFALKDRYLQRLVELRGLAHNTIVYDGWALTDFLSRVLGPDGLPSSLSERAIERFFHERRPQLARRTFHHTVCVVRSFLRYGYECGELPRALHLFELPQSFRFEQPPRALPWNHVVALLASFDRSTSVGRRDHAMVHLLAFYGMRPGEVASLRLGDIDWNSATLRVLQSKVGSTLLLPVAHGTLEILAEHLGARRRESPDRPIFVCAQPPFGSMTNGLVTTRFKVAVRRSGLPFAHASAYALRHTFAMRLLGAGVGVQEIGGLMGHRSMFSTAAYLRIQSDMLREVALDVPSVGAPQ